MSGYELFADLSHWQSPVDFVHYPYKRVGLKATDGASGIDPTYEVRAKQAHAAGLSVLHYCFAEPGDGAAQARFLLDNMIWHSGDRLVIDAEVNGVTRTEVTDFINECHRLKPSAKGDVYGSPGFLNPRRIRPSHGWGLWEADYTNAPAPDPVGGWKSWEFWQFSQTSSVAGIGGQCDLSRVAVTPAPKTRHLPPHVSVAVRVASTWLARYGQTGKVPLREKARGRLNKLAIAIELAERVK